MLLLFLGGTYTPPSAVDVWDAIYDHATADGGLQALLGTGSWLWRDEAPAGQALPYIVVQTVQLDQQYENTGSAGDVPWVATGSWAVYFYAATRSQLITLDTAWEAALNDSSLVFSTGYLMMLRHDTENDTMDPARGPGGIDVWQRQVPMNLAIGGSASTPSTRSIATSTDIFDAIYNWATTDSTLPGLMGSSNWLFQEEAPAGQTMPYVIVHSPDFDQEFESIGSGGDVPWWSQGSFHVSIFATTRTQLQAIEAAWVASLNDAPLVYTSGYLLMLRHGFSQEMLDPDRGPGGVDVWQRVISMNLFFGGAN